MIEYAGLVGWDAENAQTGSELRHAPFAQSIRITGAKTKGEQLGIWRLDERIDCRSEEHALVVWVCR